jgi:hypothetical protein
MMMTVMMIIMMIMMTPMQQKASVYLCFLFHASSVWAHSIEEELHKGLRARQTPFPPSNNNVVDLAVGGWLLSLVFLLVVVVVILFLGFSPLLSSLQFLHLEQTLCFLFWVCFVFCLQVGGRDIQDLK